MPNVGDIIEFKDWQSLVGSSVPVLNVYHFRVETMTTPDALFNIRAALTSWFYDGFLVPVRNVQPQVLSHDYAEVNNLSNYAIDFCTIAPATLKQGAVASEFSANSVAWSFEYHRQTRSTRNGGKRIGGVPESLVSNNVATAAAITLLNACCIGFNNPDIVNYGTGDTMQLSPVIIRKGVPPSFVPAVVNDVASVSYRGVGSQNSRKRL